jgi:twitching motility protein PilT
MALADSLLSAIVRADGDALVMHVGERPYVVVGTHPINISTHGLTLDAMTGMLAQLLPGDAQTQLEEFGAVEYRIPQEGDDRFSVVAARGGDDIWIEIRRRRSPAATTERQAVSAEAQAEPGLVPSEEVAAEPIPEPFVEVAPPEHQEEAPAIVEVHEIAEAPVIVDAPAVEAPLVVEAAPIEAPAVIDTPAIAAEAQAVAAFEHAFEIAASPAEPPVAEKQPVEPLEPPVADEPGGPVPITEPAHAVEAEEQPAGIEEPMTAADEREVEAIAEEVEAVLAVVETSSVGFAEAAADTPASLETTRIDAPPVAPPRHDVPVSPSSEPAVIAPLTRTVRIEVPPRTGPARAASDVDRLLRLASARGATALFLTSESRPWMRLGGELRYLDSEAPLSRADVERTLLELAPENVHDPLGRGEAVEWTAEFENVGRVRCTTFTDHRGAGALLRIIATRTATAEQLGLAQEVQALATESQGLVLVAGPRASGKSTLLSALVDLVNRQRAEYVITLERQIRLVHDNQRALVSQREIRGDSDAAVAAARASLGESPDVLVVDDLVSAAIVPVLLTAASEGLLVFASIAASSTTEAVARFVELATPETRPAVQTAMAESFRGALGQLMLKKAGGGVLAAREVLLVTAAVTRAIGDGQLGQLPLAIESGRQYGMVSFNDALVDLVRSRTVDIREAFRKAHDREGLVAALKQSGVDASAVERLV